MPIPDAGGGGTQPADSSLSDTSMPSDASTRDGTQNGSGSGGEADTGTPEAQLSATHIDFGAVFCGAPSVSQTLTVTNSGGGTLAVSASITSSAVNGVPTFSMMPTTVQLTHGQSVSLPVTAVVQSSEAAGTADMGSLNLATNDASKTMTFVPLTLAATGATLGLDPRSGGVVPSPPGVSFPTTKVNIPASPIDVRFINTGNAPVSVSLAPLAAGSSFSLSGVPDGGLVVNPAHPGDVTAGFTPPTTGNASETVAITTTGALCATPSTFSTLKLTGEGVVGQVSGFPTGNGPGDHRMTFTGNCDGTTTPTGSNQFTLTNSGAVGVSFTASVDPPNAGFSVTQAGQIPPDGGTFPFVVTVPPYPAPSQMATPALPGAMPPPIQATVTVKTDADPPGSPGTPITLVLNPSGASLAFDTTSTGCTSAGVSDFSDFGSLVLLQPPTPHAFCVKNAGTVEGSVSLSIDGQDGGVSTGLDAGARPAFALQSPTLQVTPAGSATDSVLFAPVATGANVGSLKVAVDPSVPLCAPLPAPLPLAGSGVGGGISINPSSLSFAASCGAVPGAQSFTVTNAGTLDMRWSMPAQPFSGPGAALYQISSVTQPSSNPEPGLLHPGETSTITVTPIAAAGALVGVADPAALAASVTITTDIPFDSPHSVALQAIPLGDQLSVSVGNLAFGQFPVGHTTDPQTFTIKNNANPGPGATNAQVSFAPSDGVFTVSPLSVSLAPGASQSISVQFSPAARMAYAATITLMTSGDALCTPLPSPIQVSGTGTVGVPVVTPTSHNFGLVDCGSVASPQQFTISNSGNQAFALNSISLGKGSTATSPFQLVNLPSLPIQLAPLTGSVVFNVAPNPIPGPTSATTVADPNDPLAYSDTLSVTTDAPNGGLQVPLAMQPHGAVIVDTQPPLRTTWDFGTIGFGSVGTLPSIIQNVGNAPVSVTLDGLQTSSAQVFGLASSPTVVGPNSIVDVLGHFVPNAADGSWIGQGTLTVTPSALCKPLPAQWKTPTIHLSGSSNSTPPITARGGFSFSAINCGDGPPAPQALVLTNNTNKTYPVSATFQSGAHYSVALTADGGTSSGGGILPADGVATIVVTPQAILPGPGVQAGSAPYADSVFVSVGSPPIWTSTFAVTWQVNGAVLALPKGDTYVADSTTGYTIAITNSGTATATIKPTPNSGLFTVWPPSAGVAPGGSTHPRVLSTAQAPDCPNTQASALTLDVFGPVCQPLPSTTVIVQSCVGTVP